MEDPTVRRNHATIHGSRCRQQARFSAADLSEFVDGEKVVSIAERAGGEGGASSHQYGLVSVSFFFFFLNEFRIKWF